MARKLTPDEGRNVTKDHNVAARKALIQECADKMVAIKGKRQALNEEAGEVRKRLKDAGLQTKVFEHHLRLRELEEEAQQQWLDDQTEMMEALPIGTQLSMLPNEDAPAPTEKPKASRKKSANGTAKAAAPASSDGEAINQAGVDAGFASKDRDSNPHPKMSADWKLWDQGWVGGQRKLAARGNGSSAPTNPQPPAAA